MPSLSSSNPNRIRPLRCVSWTAQADARLIQMRADGLSVRMIAQAFALSRTAIAVRANKLGLNLPSRPHPTLRPVCEVPGCLQDRNREPLPAGHPISWQAITDGTSIEGAAYQPPDPSRLRPTAADRSR